MLNFTQSPGVLRYMRSPHYVKCLCKAGITRKVIVLHYKKRMHRIHKHLACVAHDASITSGWKPRLNSRTLRVDTWRSCCFWNSHIWLLLLSILFTWHAQESTIKTVHKTRQQTGELDGYFCSDTTLLLEKTASPRCYKFKRDTSDNRVGHFSPYGGTVRTMGLGSSVSFEDFGPVWTVPKCLSALPSPVRSVLLPHKSS